ncbi:PREDICTED: E3 ubiquitin-protein ligase SINAT2-like isoform X2 [Prunus mume]|uniref:RING-type E3 ubiquitin transferase n=1 Tax=Prunus mume TaxID=102107 RepID=A0ABM1LYF5_PRUMU|nr:PREDICTED: E3 ubiquitin-protein ligase SINAT2-like isoform X2 [Prunus mume]
MSPGGRFCEDVAESRMAFADSDVATSTGDVRTSPFRKAAPGLLGIPGMPSNHNVHDLLECPVCMNLMCPPIHQCPNGHTLCSSCKARVHNCCPTCRNELGNIRCLALEKVAESLDLPCRYQIYGCQDIFPYYSKLKHEKICKYRPYNCPYAGADCSVTGDIQLLMMHLKNDHKVDMHDGCTFNHRYVKSNPQEVDNATWMLTCRFLTVLGVSFACILRLSTLELHLFTWPSFGSWVMMMRQSNSIIVLKLVAVAESLYGKEFLGVSEIATEKFVTVKMD